MNSIVQFITPLVNLFNKIASGYLCRLFAKALYFKFGLLSFENKLRTFWPYRSFVY